MEKVWDKLIEGQEEDELEEEKQWKSFQFRIRKALADGFFDSIFLLRSRTPTIDAPSNRVQ